MAIIEIEESDNTVAELVRRADKGDDIVITRNGIPQARLVSIPKPPGGKRKLGQLAGLGIVPADFDDPLPEEVIALFEGR